MRNLQNIIIFLSACAMLFAGCGENIIVDTTAGDRLASNAKEIATKADQWNSMNNPELFQTELNYKLSELPKQGRSEHIPWPATYWPTYEDSVNVRWQGKDKLNAVEKYDAAFNGWDPAAVEGLRPMDSSDCTPDTWDDAYYENLGPAAAHTSNNMGNKKTRTASRDGLLKKNCKAKDDNLCLKACNDNENLDDSARSYCKKSCHRGGVETWWGLCHAWVPAAMLEQEPMHAVEHNGHKFEVSDIKALLIDQYNRTRSYIINDRCNAREVERDDEGRVKDDECRDTNAGTYHLIMANFLGVMKRAVAEDRTYNYEVWNQPIIEWEVTDMNEITAAAANQLLGIEGDIYKYNENAKTFFEVRAKSYYITESQASTKPFTDEITSYTNTDDYHYILELDADGKINGGEWIGYSQTSHPDFLWLPVSARLGNPSIDMSNVKMLLEKSREISIGNDTTTDGEILTFDNTFEFDIPDNNDTGVTSTIEIHDSHSIGRLEVEINIEHTYIADLTVTLRKGDKEKVLHNEAGGSSDNIKKTYTVNTFAGMDAKGTWELVVTDSANADVGKIKNWKLKVNTSTSAATSEGNFVANSTGSVDIPDNTPEGGVSTINVDASHSIRRMAVTVDIEHSYVGAIVVELKHGAVKKILHNMQGGAEASIAKTFELDDFNGDLTSGAWELKVVDTDGYDDSGSINSWNIEFTY